MMIGSRECRSARKIAPPFDGVEAVGLRLRAARMGMLVVETVAKVRRDHDRGKSIKAIVRETGLSRNTVRKALRAESAQFSYRRSVKPRPELGGFARQLDGFLEANERAGKRDRLRLTRIHDLLRREGFGGSYDAVRRYAARWKRERRRGVTRHSLLRANATPSLTRCRAT